MTYSPKGQKSGEDNAKAPSMPTKCSSEKKYTDSPKSNGKRLSYSPPSGDPGNAKRNTNFAGLAVPQVSPTNLRKIGCAPGGWQCEIPQVSPTNLFKIEQACVSGDWQQLLPHQISSSNLPSAKPFDIKKREVANVFGAREVEANTDIDDISYGLGAQRLNRKVGFSPNQTTSGEGGERKRRSKGAQHPSKGILKNSKRSKSKAARNPSGGKKKIKASGQIHRRKISRDQNRDDMFFEMDDLPEGGWDDPWDDPPYPSPDGNQEHSQGQDYLDNLIDEMLYYPAAGCDQPRNALHLGTDENGWPTMEHAQTEKSPARI